jgi:hypothetical protein
MKRLFVFIFLIFSVSGYSFESGSFSLKVGAGGGGVASIYVNEGEKKEEFPKDTRSYTFYGLPLYFLMGIRAGEDEYGFHHQKIYKNRFAYYTSHKGYFTDIELGVLYFLSAGGFTVKDKNQEKDYNTITKDGFTKNTDGLYTFEGEVVEDKDSYDIYSPIKFLNIFLNCYVRHWHILLLDLSLGVSLQVQYEKDFSDVRKYLDKDFMTIDDHTIGSIGIVVRGYLDLLRRARIYARVVVPIVGMISRVANFSSNISNEIWSFEGGIDVFLINYIFGFLGAKYDYYRVNPNSEFALNSTRGDGDYNILHHKGALFFYVGAGLFLSWSKNK